MNVDVTPMNPRDWDTVRAIYREGIASGDSTFEKDAPAWEKWDRDHLRSCRLVARSQGEVVGWAALSPVSARSVYAGVAEASIYVAERARRKGIGSALLSALIAASQREGMWTLQAGIFPENTASLDLCVRAGFRIVGTRERLGCMDGRWRDVLLLERRSAVAGVGADARPASRWKP
jgi:phosphinothricin acetyltransferase